MNLKKILAIPIALCVFMGNTSLTSSALSLSTATNPNEKTLITESKADFDTFAKSFNNTATLKSNTPSAIQNATTSLPSNVDLSISPCFPPIGEQSNIGSCVAWATTYYQYSYEVNKLNNVQSTANRVLYSPAWTYNLNNGGSTDDGIGIGYAYETLRNQGCLKLSDMPYNKYNYDPNYIPNNTSAMRNALGTRLTDYKFFSVPIAGTSITSNTDSDLTRVKSFLNAGKVLVINSCDDFDYKKGTGSWSNTKLVYRCHDKNKTGHTMTVVGYDDNVTCDINGNGVIESGEKGAFKVANSWGLNNISANNSGFIWLMYDSLNNTSANNLNEGSFKYTRVPAISSGTFSYINVGKYKVYLVAEVGYKTNYKGQVSVNLKRGTSEKLVKDYNFMYGATYAPFNGTLVFDYSELANPINTYCKGYSWAVNIVDNYAKSSTPTTLNSLRITDNKGNRISGGNLVSPATFDNDSCLRSFPINLRKGDLNYDGKITSNDISLAAQFKTGIRTPSNLQRFLNYV